VGSRGRSWAPARVYWQAGPKGPKALAPKMGPDTAIKEPDAAPDVRLQDAFPHPGTVSAIGRSAGALWNIPELHSPGGFLRSSAVGPCRPLRSSAVGPCRPLTPLV